QYIICVMIRLLTEPIIAPSSASTGNAPFVSPRDHHAQIRQPLGTLLEFVGAVCRCEDAMLPARSTVSKSERTLHDFVSDNLTGRSASFGWLLVAGLVLSVAPSHAAPQS